MGASNSGWCSGACLEKHLLGDTIFSNGMQTEMTPEAKVVLRIDHAPIHDAVGAHVSGFKCGDEIILRNLSHANDLDVLNWRYREQVRAGWPQSYRFQVPRHKFAVTAQSRDKRETACILQMPQVASERTVENAQIHVDDAALVADHAARFNLQMVKSIGCNGIVSIGDPGEAVPTVKVCAPVACEVVSTSYPDMLPKGAACTLTPYRHQEIRKFVFDGSEEFLEVPQAFFHYVAFVSRNEEFACDLQGVQDDSGVFDLLDPVVLSADKGNVTQFLSSFTAPQRAGLTLKEGPLFGPTECRFEALHPKCGQLCHTFDPNRRGVKGKKGFCGLNCM